MCNLDTLLNDRLTKISAHAFERHVERLAEDIRLMRAALQARAWWVDGELGLVADDDILKDFPPKRLPGLDAWGRWRPLANQAVLKLHG
jgi:hypothetical protein